MKKQKKTNNNYAKVGNQLCIAAVYLRQKRYEEGLIMYQEVYEESKKANMEPFKLIEALNGVLFTHNHLKRPEEAMRYAKIADSITIANNLPDTRNLDFLLYKSTILYQLGAPQEGDAVLKRYINAKDSLYSEKNVALIQTKETEFRTKEKEQMIVLQNTALAKQRLLNVLLGGGALLFALIGFLIYRQQKLKIKHQQQEQQLKEILHTVETQNKLEEQRIRISKELHDNIGSQLTYLASATQNIEMKLASSSTEETQKKLIELSTFSQDAIRDLRDTIWVMNKSAISWEDLLERSRYLAQKVSNSTQIMVEVKNKGENHHQLDASKALNIFRIIQEAINNAVKHANASKISVAFYLEDAINIKIEDNGKGFDTTAIHENSFGMQNMKSRAATVNAEINIASSENGTIITVLF